MNNPEEHTKEFPLLASRRACREIARKNAGNFFLSFLLLPSRKQQAMYALYAFLRISDDLADSELPLEEKKICLLNWRDSTELALRGEFSHPIHPALREMVESFHLPKEYLFEALDGVGMDLERNRYDDFLSLYGYCYKVASIVGLSCIQIWGYKGQEALQFAEAAGVALQLTNIMRDVGEDARRGRIYLPMDEMKRFGCSEENLLTGVRDDNFKELMRFQAQRAKAYYAQGECLLPYLSRSGRAIFLSLFRTYGSLLEQIEKNQFDVFNQRARVPGLKKITLALKAFLGAWLKK